MKKIITMIFAFCILALNCSCSQTNNLKKINIVTVCAVEKNDESTNYMFNVSKISSSDNEGDNEEKDIIYKFNSTNFKEAVSKLEETIGIVDFGHLGLFLSDVSYLKSDLWKDIESITSKTKVNPMVKFFVCSDNSIEVLNTICSSYGSGYDDYIEKVYGYDKKNLLCTLPEIVFAHRNAYFNASVPVIGIDQNALVAEEGIIVCSPLRGYVLLGGKDYDIFRNYLIKYGKSSRNLNIKINDDKINIKINEAQSDKTYGIAETARHYKDMGYDILNGLYFSKKKFATYKLFDEYMRDFSLNNLKYE